MSSETILINLTITHRGTTLRLSPPPDTTLAVLHARLEELTSVPPELQKLLYKGKQPRTAVDDTLAAAGLKDGAKVQLLGPTAQELSGMRAEEDAHARRARILRERASTAPTKVRATGASSAADAQYRFHALVPLPHLPHPAAAHALLTRLAHDPALAHVMRAHRLAVGVLTELAPHEAPHLLGLNENAGQAVKLCLRTDAYDGFRAYGEVRRVLCHELAHNVWGAHDDNFKELNSRLNREVAEFERAAAEGTHYLVGTGDTYTPSSELEAEAHSYVLGGDAQVLSPGTSETPDERRRRVLEATMKRLQREEAELEDRCEITRPSGV